MRNPQSADTLDGIVRWRLLSELVHRKINETHSALNWLVQQGYLLETVSCGIDPVFSLNPERRTEAEGLMRDLDAAPSRDDR